MNKTFNKTKLPDQISQQLSKRHEDRNKDLFTLKPNDKSMGPIFLLSSSDIGVIRNGGRQGAFMGPKVIMAELKKFQKSSANVKSFTEHEVSFMELELKEFKKGQKREEEQIKKHLPIQQTHPIIHIGGGHDHIFPFLTALEDKYPNSKLNIINIDAHLDTRDDQEAHSGTPFRQFFEKSKKGHHLHQIGIQSESNPLGNFKELNNVKMQIHQLEKIEENSKLISIFQESLSQQPDTLNILSFDVDALHSKDFSSCSAVNPNGFSDSQMNQIFSTYKKNINHPQIIGIYEYNPLYDDLSNRDGKKLAWKIQQSLK